ncbi:dynein axonemal heavy chain 6-like [Mustelus asterias]
MKPARALEHMGLDACVNMSLFLPPLPFQLPKVVHNTVMFAFPLQDAATPVDRGDFLYYLTRTRNDPRARYNPYDLQVVSADEAKSYKQYWTISASYVSKITSLYENGGIETISVREWLAERSHFYRVYQLPVFVNFRRWKAFNVWKLNVRNSKISNSRKKVKRKYILLKRRDPDTKESYEHRGELQTQRRAADTEESCRHRGELQTQRRAADTEESCRHRGELQTQRRAADTEESCRHRGELQTQRIVTNRGTAEMILEKQLFFADEIFQRCLYHIRALCEDTSSSNGGLGTGDNAIVFVKLDRMNSYSGEQFAEVQSEQRKHALKQICDLRYKIIQSVKESCREKAKVEGFEKVFTTEPDKSNERPAFTEIVESRPLLDRFIKFLKVVDYLFQELICRLVKTVVRLLLDTFTASFMVTSTDERRNEELLSTLPHHTRVYLDKRLRIMQHGSEAADEVFSMSQGSDIIANQPEKSTNDTAVDVDQEFRIMLEVYNEHIMDMRNMTVERRVRMIKVLSRQFQMDCLPYSGAVVDALHTHMLSVAHVKNLQLMAMITEALQMLEKEPETIDLFGEHLIFLSRISAEMPMLERDFTAVTQLYAIANEYSIFVPPEDLALYHILIPSFQNLKARILYCEAMKHRNVAKFKANLEEDISNLYYELLQVKYKVTNPTLLQSETAPSKALAIIHALMNEISTIANKARNYSNYQDRFCGSDMTESSSISNIQPIQKCGGKSTQAMNALLSEAEYELMLRKLLWESQGEWAKLYSHWTNTLFDELNVDAIQKDVNRFTQTIYMLEKGLPANDIVPLQKQAVLDFKETLPVIVALRNPWLESQHWDNIEYTIGRSIKDKNLTLESLTKLRVYQRKEAIIHISALATNEATLKNMLGKVVTLWNQTSFKLVAHQVDTYTVLIIGSPDEIIAQLEDSLITISTIKGSRYVEPIKKEVAEWDRKLNLMAQTIEEWMTCQRNWLYLNPIFQAPDIQRQLPTETKLFAQIDAAWNELIMKVQSNTNILKATTAAGVLELLQTTNANLEKILKCLEDYLEAKRISFPRFYFLSNSELLDILSQSKNPEAIRPHLAKCFENIRSLEIFKQATRPPIVVMIKSAENENLPMPRNIRIRGPIEQWLGNVETAMFESVKKHLQMGINTWKSTQFKEWVLSHPGQVVLTVSQIMFNRDCEKCFSGSKPHSQLQDVHQVLMGRLDGLAELMSRPLRAFQETMLETLLTINVHCRDILSELIAKKIFKADDFEWTRQLRYEWNVQNNTCYVVQAKSSFTYGYEYLGCSPRLVITPLTDRCWLTLTGALHLNLGGSPAGPTGTGKTATVKDLAKALGKHCVVFNCSEGLDYKMMGKLFSGMAQSGAWFCFDEFNRIDVEVLSVTASQIHTIKAAKDSEALRFVFEGREIRLNMSCSFFATMNPGYEGRVELPDNLKSLFRPVAMMVPDSQLIAEIILFSEGFKSAKSLSGKIVDVYQLASKQLSQQDHYDFGMRSIKSVLVMAGQKKRAVEIERPKMPMSQIDESHILIRALKDANLPKFLAEDVPLFEHILDDLFPGLTSPKEKNILLQKAIAVATSELEFQHWPSQEEKIIQLYSQILVHPGVMLVGPTCGGKTTARTILQKALAILPSLVAEATADKSSSFPLLTPVAKRGKVETLTINPKCITLGELYGYVDPNTMDWFDGLFAQAMRKFAKDLQKECDDIPDMKILSSTFVTVDRNWVDFQEHENLEFEDTTVPSSWRWIIMDGPVDTVWAENLNTVLDDTRTLCLANGERISLPQGMRLIFEVDSLSQASPATISRCAMVYMDPVDLGWWPYVNKWFGILPEELPHKALGYLQTLFDKSISAGLTFVANHRKLQQFAVTDLGIVMTLCHLLEAFLVFMSRNGGFGAGTAQPNEESKMRDGLQRSKAVPSISISPGESSGTLEGEASSGQTRSERWFLEKHPDKLPALLAKLYMFSFTWAVGGCLKREDDYEEEALIGLSDRSKEDAAIKVTLDFDSLVHSLFEGQTPLSVQFPSSNLTVFGYFVDMQTGSLVPWEKLVPSTQTLISKGVQLSSLDEAVTSGAPRTRRANRENLVCTVDTVRYSFITSLLLLNSFPVLLTGESGVGKSALIEEMLSKLQEPKGTLIQPKTILGNIFYYNEMKRESSLVAGISHLTEGFNWTKDSGPLCVDGVCSGQRMEFPGRYGVQADTKSSRGDSKELLVNTMLFSTQTTSAQAQAQILQRLVKRSRNRHSSVKSKQVIVFLDDLNMPAVEQYGAQPPLELIRQFLDLGGFFDIQNFKWLRVQDVTLVAACAPPNGARTELSQRLLKHFSIFTLPQPSTQSLQHIFQVKWNPMQLMADPFMFGDFMDMYVPSASRIYKQIIDVKKLENILADYHFRHSSTNLKVIYPVFFKEAVEHIIRAARVFSQSGGHLMMVGVDSTGKLTNTTLACYVAECELAVLSIGPHYSHTDFREDLKKFFKQAGVFGVKTVLLLADEDLIKGCRGNLCSTSQSTGCRGDLCGTSQSTGCTGDLCGTSQSTGCTGDLCGTSQSTGCTAGRTEEDMEDFQISSAGEDIEEGTEGEPAEEAEEGLRTMAQWHHRIATEVRVSDLLEDTGDGCPYYLRDIAHRLVWLTLGSWLLSPQLGLEQNKAQLIRRVPFFSLVQETFLEDLNCLVHSGQVPGLFDNEELDNIILELKNHESEGNLPDNRKALHQFFLQRVRDRLHIALAMSPAGSMFRLRCRMNPSLVNCSTMDWYDKWSKDALLRVAHTYFTQVDFEEPLKESVAKACVDIHNSVSSAARQFWQKMRRYYYVTPSKYLGLIHGFSDLLKKKRIGIMNSRNRFANGLLKLSEASSMVGVMQEELVPLGPQIEQKTKEVEQLMQKLQSDTEAVEEVRAIVKREEEIMAEETQIVEDYAKQATNELNDVLPVLEMALTALQALDKSDISEIRVYTNPPTLVLTVMNAVCILLQKSPHWTTAKLLLADPSFLKHLLKLDKDSIPEKVFTKLKIYSRHPDFTPERVGMVSTACRSLCQWVLAIQHYHEVRKAVAPKQQHVVEAQEALAIAKENLRKKHESLRLVEEHQQSLQQLFNDTVEQKDALANRKVLTMKRISRAAVLITALGNEKVRWKESLDALDRHLHGIVGDTLLSAADITYCGPFTADFREGLMEKWITFLIKSQIPMSPDYSFIPATAEKNTVRILQNKGLPANNYSTENAILVKLSQNWPLLIDPQGQASNWIITMEAHELRILLASDPNYMNTMETAIRMGNPVLLQDLVEKIDPGLRPILVRDICIRAGQEYIKIGSTEIEYNSNFRLYMTTRISNPNFLPAVCNLVTLINCTVTFEGLQEQLLSRVVKRQHPQVEEQLGQLLQSIANDLVTLMDLENKSLSLLQKTEGHILDDQDLIDTLQKSKDMSKEIKLRIAASEENERKIMAARKKYLPMATHGSVMYFVMAELAKLNCMYQFSLHWFMKIFTESVSDMHKPHTRRPLAGFIQRASKLQRTGSEFKHLSSSTARMHISFKSYLRNMMNTLTENTYKLVWYALFTQHQLCFSFMLCSSIMRTSQADKDELNIMGFLPEAEWQTFLNINILANVGDGKEPLEKQGSKFDTWLEQSPNVQWMTEVMWKRCLYINTHIKSFALLCKSMNTYPIQWEAFLKAEDLYNFLKRPFYLLGMESRPGLNSVINSEPGLSLSEQSIQDQETIFPWELLSAFQCLILIKILRPECLIAAVRDFVAEKLGPDFLPSPTVHLKDAFDETDASTPLIFLLSPGTDPVTQVLRFAKECRGGTEHLDMVSLGRGQGPIAEDLIHKAQIHKGRWVFLQNCHLAAYFMPTLQNIIQSFRKPEVYIDPNFRLLLSSKSDHTFPISILHQGVKVAVEPPQGLKNKLLSSFGSGGSGEVTEGIFMKESTGLSWRRLLFSLCCFNAIIQERNKYGALGWNIPYQFASSDLEVAIQNLEMLIRNEVEIPWTALRYLTGEVVYGGRVTDGWDRRCLNSTLNWFYRPEVLEEGFSFSTDGVYSMISEKMDLLQCINHIETLPDTDSPDIFGMHPNTQKAYLESQASEFMDTIEGIEPHLSAGLQSIREQRSEGEIVVEKAEGLLKKLPETVEGVHESDDTLMSLSRLLALPAWKEYVESIEGYDCLTKSALLTILRQEINRFNRLLSLICSSLRSLCLAVKGQIILSDALEDTYNSFLSMKMPKLWQLHSYESCKPLASWIDDLIDRVNFFKTWSRQFVATAQQRIFPQTTAKVHAPSAKVMEEVGSALPHAFWLSAFFFPQGFLTALLQNHARKHRISVDTVTFEFHVLPLSKQTEESWSIPKRKPSIWMQAFKYPTPPEDGAILFGFYLDGACWDPDRHILKDSNVGHRYCQMPEILFLPVQIDGQRASLELGGGPQAVKNCYECPLYQTSRRAGTLSSTGHSTNFVIAINLPTVMPGDHWVTGGVALLCQLDD